MKTVLASLAAVAALAAAAGPAAAQPYGYHHDRGDGGAYAVNGRQEVIQRQIDRGVRTGQLTPREAARLQDQFRDVRRLEARYRMNGLSPWERADLDRRLDRLEAQTRFQRHDDQHRRW